MNICHRYNLGTFFSSALSTVSKVHFYEEKSDGLAYRYKRMEVKKEG